MAVLQRPGPFGLTRGQTIALAVLVLAAGAAVLSPFAGLEKLRVLSAGVCAQRIGHSLLFGGVQPPLESRMIGIYGGFAVASAVFAAFGRISSGRMTGLGGLLAAVGMIGVMGFDGSNAFLYDLRVFWLYAPDNRLRLFTGLMAGTGIALIVLPVLNATLLANAADRPIVQGWRQWAALAAGQAAFAALCLTGADFLLWPVSIVSVGGIFALVVALNALFLSSIVGRENSVASLRTALPVLAACAPLAALELLALAGLRFWAEATLGITPL